MNTFHSRGDRIPFANTTGTIILSSSVVVLTAGASGGVGIAVADIPATTGIGELETCGVQTLPALTTDTATAETNAYWDATNLRITTTSTSNTLAGKFAAVKTNGQTTARILLNGRVHP